MATRSMALCPPLPRPRHSLAREPRHTIRTSAAFPTCGSSLDTYLASPQLLRLDMRARSDTWRGTLLSRGCTTSGPIRTSRQGPCSAVEPPCARIHSETTRIKSEDKCVGCQALSLHPPLRAQMSAARRECGLVERALRSPLRLVPIGRGCSAREGVIWSPDSLALLRRSYSGRPPGRKVPAGACAGGSRLTPGGGQVMPHA